MARRPRLDLDGYHHIIKSQRESKGSGERNRKQTHATLL